MDSHCWVITMIDNGTDSAKSVRPRHCSYPVPGDGMTIIPLTQPDVSTQNDPDVVDRLLKSSGLNIGEFNIEEYWSTVNRMEDIPGIRFIRMDFGVPGLAPSERCLVNHQAMLSDGKTPLNYPPSTGLPSLNSAVARFAGQRLGICVDKNDVFVTCGATQALFVAQSIATRLKPSAGAVAFLTPNYPPMCAQARFLGMDIVSIEVDGCQGPRLLEAVRTAFKTREIAAFCWASPSNPGWMVLTDGELAGIATLCREFDVIPIEDLTYLGMVTSANAQPFERLPSIARHIDDYFLVLSASKMLSYAGERIGFLVASTHLLGKESESLEKTFGVTSVRRACSSFIFNLTAGAPHSAQYAVASVIESVNRGEYDLDKYLAEYMRRGQLLAALLERHGFYLIYSTNNKENGAGFYVSFGYPGLTELELLKELIYVGITVLPLSIFGSERGDGVRACVGRLDEDKMSLLDRRLGEFMGGRYG